MKKKSIYVLMYHYVREIKNSKYPKIKGVELEIFKKQLDYLKLNFNIINGDDLIDFLKFVATDQNGVRLDKEDDNFKLYVKISKDAKNSHPNEIITHDYFSDYRIKKNMFPKKLYYSLN